MTDWISCTYDAPAQGMAAQEDEGIDRGIAVSADGLRIAYEALGPHRHPLLIANGLGTRLYVWQRLVNLISDQRRILIWDYRGMFDSESPADPAGLALARHADDAAAVLNADGKAQAVVIGWSLGVQAALELALRYPEKVKGLILINGAHSHAVQTSFQPFFKAPGIGKLLRAALEAPVKHPWLLERVAAAGRQPWLPRLIGNVWGWIHQNPDIPLIYQRYTEDVFGPSFKNFLRMFSAIDEHSTSEQLEKITQPALILSGGLDFVTPAYCSRQMAKRMPNARHINIPLGTHYLLLEYPQLVLPAICSFLNEIDPA